MAVKSYSVLAFSPCATAKKPASRCHASPSRTTGDLECDFPCSSYYCTMSYAIGVAGGESTCIALQSRVHRQLAICCAYPWVSCERHRTTYAGPSEGTLHRYLSCRVNRIMDACFSGPRPCKQAVLMLPVYSAYLRPPLTGSQIMNDRLLFAQQEARDCTHTTPCATFRVSQLPPHRHPHLQSQRLALAKDTSIILRRW